MAGAQSGSNPPDPFPVRGGGSVLGGREAAMAARLPSIQQGIGRILQAAMRNPASPAMVIASPQASAKATSVLS